MWTSRREIMGSLGEPGASPSSDRPGSAADCSLVVTYSSIVPGGSTRTMKGVAAMSSSQVSRLLWMATSNLRSAALATQARPPSRDRGHAHIDGIPEVRDEPGGTSRAGRAVRGERCDPGCTGPLRPEPFGPHWPAGFRSALAPHPVVTHRSARTSARTSVRPRPALPQHPGYSQVTCRRRYSRRTGQRVWICS